MATKFTRPLLLSLLQLSSTVLIELASVVVLARLLTPEETGVFTAGMAVLAIFRLLSNFGQYEYLIQAPTIPTSLRRSTLGLSLSIALGGALALTFGAWLFPQTLLDEELRRVAMILGIALTFHPFTFLPVALLHREMRFGAMYVGKVLGSAIFACVAIALAAAGFGAESLAWATLLSTVAFAVAANAFTGFSFVLRPSATRWADIAHRSHTFTLIGATNQIIESGVSLVIGQVLGFGDLGVFGRAREFIRRIERLLKEGLMPVLTPFLANQARAGEDIKASYLTKIAYLSLLLWPLGGFLALYAAPIVSLLLGPQWQEVVPILQLLCIGILVMPFTATVFSFVISLELQRQFLPITLVIGGLRIVAVTALAMFSLPLAATGFVAAEVVNALWIHRLLNRSLALSGRDVIDAVGPSGAMGLLALLAPALLSLLLDGDLAFDLLLMTCAAASLAACWGLGIRRMKRTRSASIDRAACT